MRLGEILLEERLLSRDRLSQVLRYQRQNGGFLGSLLVDLGLVPEVTVVRLLASQFGVPGVCLSNRVPSEDVRGFLSEEEARRLGALPLELDGDVLHVAFARPNDATTLRSVSRRTSRKILPAVAVRSRLDFAIRSSYRSTPRAGERPRYVWASPGSVERGRSAPPIIPRALLFGHAAVSSVSLSPDGRRVSYLGASRRGRGRALFVQPVSLSESVELADDGEIRLYWQHWTSDAHILYGGDVKGNENAQIFSVNVRTGVSKPLPQTGHGHGRRRRSDARLLHLSPRGEAVVQLYDTKDYRCRVYRVDLRSGRHERVRDVPRGFVRSFWADGTGELRVCLRYEEGASALCVRTGTEWLPFFPMPHEDWSSVEVVDVDDSGRYCFILDGYHHALTHLVRIDLRSGKRVVVAAPRAADIEEALIEGADVKSVVEYHPRVNRRIFCPDLRKHYELLSVETGGIPRVRDRVSNDRIWLVESSSDVCPSRYYLYDRPNGRVRLLFDSRPGLARYALENMTPVEIPARDGLKLPGYLTLPSWTPKRRALPTVLLLHGGPTARDYWGFDAEHQWLANRGYAVLSVNYRGSTGFGKRLRRATPYWIAPEMVEDVLDAAVWTMEKGIADPKRLGVMGASYGGYLVLECLARAPELFQCGVDLFGVSDWKSCEIFDSAKKRLGLGADATRALLEARSPLYYSDRIRKPLLVAQGTSDVRVPPDQSSHMVRKLAGAGRSVTYLVYDEEGHGLYREESRLSYYAVVEAFLAAHLGGRQESFGADLEDRGLRIPTGASCVPGLHAFWRASEIIEHVAEARSDRLDLAHLGLRELPTAIRKLERLRHLDLSGNRLTHLPPEIGLLSLLESLDLSANQLLALPEEVGSLRSLRELDVSVNHLSELPPSLRTIETLRRIRIEGNPLSEKSLWGFAPRTWRHSSATVRGARVMLNETRKSHA